MRDDDSLDDQYGLGDPADRSDDSPSTERLTTLPDRTAPRLFSLGSLRTRFGGLINPVPARPGRTRMGVTAGALCCLGLVGFTQVGAGVVGASDAPAKRAEAAQTAQVDQRATADAASRGEARQPVAPATPAAPATPVAKTADPDVSPSPTKTEKPKPKPKPKPKQIAPVAGLDQVQFDNAKAIVWTGRDMGVPRRGLVIAVATAMQESNLYNYASGMLPESQNYPHQAIGWDHDSVGLFQQRPSSGWGAVGDLMEPAYATHQFLTALEAVPDWQNLPLTVAAQAVQVSAFPDAYAQHEGRANQVVNALLD